LLLQLRIAWFKLNPLNISVNTTRFFSHLVNSLSTSGYVSTKLIFKQIKKAFHISCGNDIIQSRIIHAKNLLTETSLSIGEIAEQCGYKSAIHFSRQFKQHTGVSPNLWKKSRH